MTGRAPFEKFSSAAVILLRDDVDTDQIIPARFLKTVSRDGLAAGLFADWRFDDVGAPRPDFVLNGPDMAGRQILVAGANFGSGSSREHAAWALVAWGFRSVVAAGFADIFRGNALKNGLLPVELGVEGQQQVAAVLAEDPSAALTVDLEAQRLGLPDGAQLAFPLDPFSRTLLLSGADELGYLLSLGEEISAWEASHPSPISTLTRADV
jgi:3-isopropylmalate/(R)-2-methylmalate dehydratase small subunit